MDQSRPMMISIDPGTNHLGICISEVDVIKGTQKPVEAYSIDIAKLADSRFELVALEHGLRVAKLAAVRHAVGRVLEAYQPFAVESEGPYLGSFPQTFAALTECVGAIRQAVRDYDPCIALQVYDPATIKVAVGVKGKSGDKEAMRTALASGLPGLDLSEVDIKTMDEHAVDATAGGYCYIRMRAKL